MKGVAKYSTQLKNRRKFLQPIRVYYFLNFLIINILQKKAKVFTEFKTFVNTTH